MKRNLLILLIIISIGLFSCDRTHSFSIFLRTLFKTKQIDENKTSSVKIDYKLKIVENINLPDTIGYLQKSIKVYCFGDTLTYFNTLTILPIYIDLTSRPVVVNLKILEDTINNKIFKEATYLYTLDKSSNLGFKFKKMK